MYNYYHLEYEMLKDLRILTWIGFALAGLLLAACTGQPTSPPAPIESPLASPTEPSMTKPPPVPSPTTAPTILPSDTPAASPTASGPTPTPDLGSYQREASQSLSPDGRWAARVVVSYPLGPDGAAFGDTYHTLVRVVDRQESTERTVVDAWSNYGLGLTTPAVLGWSGDGQSLYLADSGVPDGCGAPFTEYLRRVDLATGSETPIEVRLGMAPTLSPDGSTLASVTETGLTLVDLGTQAETSLPFVEPSGDWWVNRIIWSPAGEALLFSVSHNPCGSPEQASGSLVLVNRAGETSQTLVEQDPRQLVPLSWPLDDLVQLGDKDGNTWWLQVSSGHVGAEPPQEIGQANQALMAFFEALHTGRYAEAAEFYGGSYEVPIDHNPGVDPNDRAALWEMACTINGAACLPVRRAVLVSQPAPDEYRFLVTFDQDGEIFVLGPCCGASIEDQPPQTEFTYTVRRDASGKFVVMDLPVYTP